MTKFTLASQSPRRIDLLKQMGLTFDVIPSNFDEDSVPKTTPRTYVKKLAKSKAKVVSKQVTEGVIIGADTVVSIDNTILGKPKDAADAARMLKLLDGKVHKVFTGVCVINKDTGEIITKAVSTQVKFRTLDNGMVDWYVKTGELFDKAGAYAMQGKGAVLVEWIKGDYYNIIGLPIVTLVGILNEMHVDFTK